MNLEREEWEYDKARSQISTSTFKDLDFLPRSLPPRILMSLLGLDILLIWEATGEGIDPLIRVRLSKELSSDYFTIFRFFIMCWLKKPLDKKDKNVKRIGT